MTVDASGGFLLAYFLDEHEPDGEAVRLAVSESPSPVSWIPLHGGRPVLRSAVGERGARDPFLVRESDGGVVLLATDLRVWPAQDWNRVVRHGSRSILVARSADLVAWSPFEAVEVAPATAGNAWAPKAFWVAENGCWLVFWASALYADGEDRAPGGYQRILVAETHDFRVFGEPSIYLDRGWDTIDTTFLEHRGRWYRFTVDQRMPGGAPDVGHHPIEEVGDHLMDPRYRIVAHDVGKSAMVRGEGPATATAASGDRWYLLVDEYGLRGYQLFETDDLAAGAWTHRADASLPPGARHGSLLPISAAERERLLR